MRVLSTCLVRVIGKWQWVTSAGALLLLCPTFGVQVLVIYMVCIAMISVDAHMVVSIS